MADDRVRIDVSDRVAQVVLTRSAKHNALDEAMFRALDAVPARLAEGPPVRAVVVHGEGPSFCSGLDVASFMSGEPGAMTVQDLMGVPDGEVANLAQRVAVGWSRIPAPVVAAIHGNCFGGGLQIALGADLRIAAPDARLSVMEVKWGLIPDMGITQSLPRLVGIDVAKELTFTGRRFDGTEAAALGVVTRVDEDPLAAALALAAEIASKSPDAVQRAKRLYDEAWIAEAPAALQLERELQTEVMGTPNQLEAVRAGIMKEPADFAD